MQNTRTSDTVAKVLRNGKIVGYLTQSNVDNGMDITLDMQGFTVEAI